MSQTTNENQTSAAFRRPISPTERLYLAGEALTPPFALQVVIEGEGRLDPEALTHAVARTAEACPGTRLVRRGRLWVDSGSPPPVRVVDGALLDRTSLVGVPALGRRLDPLAGPTCEVLLLDGDPHTVVFRAFHGVMDGRGVLTWMSDVFRVLRGAQPVGAMSPTTDQTMVSRLAAPGRRPRLRFRWPSPLGGNGTRAPGMMWRRRPVDGHHPGLVARLASAVAELAPGPACRVMVPVDLRRHDPGLASTANLTLPIFLDARRGETWEQIHERLLAALAEHQEVTWGGAERLVPALPLVAVRAMVGALGACSTLRGRYAMSAIVSHLGKVDRTEFRTDSFRPTTVYALPVHDPVTPVSLAAVECGDRTELILACRGDMQVARRAEGFLDHLEESLHRNTARTWSGNDTTTALPTGLTVTGLFREQVARTPDAVALTDPDRTLTYAELDRSSDAVAHELISRGVGAGHVVGLLAERTTAAIVGIWGVLKAGAAFVPVDPNHPDRRITDVLDDAKVVFCLVTQQYRGRVPSGQGCTPIVLEDLPASAPIPDDTVTPTDLAYVIYTSGSTGKPKGVQIEHRNLVNYVLWARRFFGVDTTMRFGVIGSFAFDGTWHSVFVPLVSGGSVALAPGHLNHVKLRDLLDRSEANALLVTVTHLDLILRLGFTSRGVRIVAVGGEQLRGTIAARAQEAFGPDCRIVNVYGPTEATIVCTAHVFDPERDATSAVVPIGVPVDNMRVFLLDPDHRHVAEGEVGEIHLAGAQLARGYLGRTDLDRTCFVRLADGTRVYRTGDLATLLPTGVLEFVGRVDDQVKIRGHRIEPAEVESVLAEHPGVRGALVVARGHGREKALWAYVVAEPEFSVRQAREYLVERLPDYMVPSAICLVPEFPTTINGKVDVAALPEAAPDQEQAAADAVERDEVTGAVSHIWADLLSVEDTGLDDNSDFHRLGGDSLALVEMFAAVARTVVGPAGEAAFMSDLQHVIRNPTLGQVCHAARRAISTTKGRPA
ncbi:hypothetical protein GCM10012275_34060 [Longimycelium tulufanense]|uniref:Carrier domain-containing protein n=1 Tax=Longimycelium tulufanense TaxID=907463 RepID=A0A8J3CDX5_9PSEU|nr:amino acid adenylation domain-containing protein [Longimycelium tulufanense]GGM60089.1 hypothetical protein GCM10012275_34060 [Longimycelium tulufanense]